MSYAFQYLAIKYLMNGSLASASRAIQTGKRVKRTFWKKGEFRRIEYKVK
jgi:hypothetical protein